MIRYKVLTLLIMVLGKLRQRATSNVMQVVRNSPLIKDEIGIDELEDRGILVICCDCGLEHRFFRHRHLSPFPERQKDILAAWPLRPEGYDYSLRLD